MKTAYALAIFAATASAVQLSVFNTCATVNDAYENCREKVHNGCFDSSALYATCISEAFTTG